MAEEKVFFDNGKGQKLCGILCLPETDKPPVIIMIHGLTGDKDEHGRFSKAAERFCQEGFCVLRFDCRGTGESDGKFEDMTIETEVEDLLAAIDYIETRNISKERVGVLGMSLGGEIAILGALKRDVKTLVLWAPVTSSERSKERFSEDEKKKFETEGKTIIRSSATGRPWLVGRGFYDSSISVKVEEEVKKLRCPVLIIHGDKDSTVPLEHSKQAFEDLNVEKRLEVIEGADHGFYNDVDKIVELSLNWFKKHM